MDRKIVLVICAAAVLVQSLHADAPSSQQVNTRNNAGVLDVDQVGGEGNVVDSADENNLNSPHLKIGGGGGSAGGDGNASISAAGVRILPWPSNRNNPSSQVVNSDGNTGVASINSVGGTGNTVKTRDHNDQNSLHAEIGGGSGRPQILPLPVPIQLPGPIQPDPTPVPLPGPGPGAGVWQSNLAQWLSNLGRPGPGGNTLARYEFNPTYQQLNSVNNRGIESLTATGGAGNQAQSAEQNNLNSPHSFLADRNPTDQSVNDVRNSGILDADITGGSDNQVRSSDENNLNSPHARGPPPRPRPRPRPRPAVVDPLAQLWASPALQYLAEPLQAAARLIPPPWLWGRRGDQNPTRQRVRSRQNSGIENIDATGGSGNRVQSSDENNLNSPHAQRSFLQEPEPGAQARTSPPFIPVPWPPRPRRAGNAATSQLVNSNNNSGVLDVDATGGVANSVQSEEQNNLNSPHASAGGGGRRGRGGRSGGRRAGGGLVLGPVLVGRGGNASTRQAVNSNNNSGVLDADAVGGVGNDVLAADENNLNSPHLG